MQPKQNRVDSDVEGGYLPSRGQQTFVQCRACRTGKRRIHNRFQLQSQSQGFTIAHFAFCQKADSHGVAKYEVQGSAKNGPQVW